jgi:DNA repair photolyase
VTVPPRLVQVPRRSAVLSPSQLHCLARLPTINLTAGCLHDCSYCYITGYSGYPGRGSVVLYSDTAERLDHELRRRRVKPRAVYFSPSSDLFQPHPAVHAMADRVLRVLFSHDVGVAFLTKGAIPAPLLRLVEDHADRVQAQIGITTLDDAIAAAFEPGAADPRARIAQAGDLQRAGVAVEPRLDPILPGITDDEQSLEDLFAAAAAAGIRSAAGVLFLRPNIARSLRATAGHAGSVDAMPAAYRGGPRLTMRGTSSAVASQPPDRRRAIFERVTRIGARHGVRVRVCACKNTDIAAGACNIAGHWQAPAQPRQGVLRGLATPRSPA